MAAGTSFPNSPAGVGPRGSVLGLDLDPTALELAAQEVDGVGNVTFRQGDVRTLQGRATPSSTRGSCSSTWPTSPTSCGSWSRAWRRAGWWSSRTSTTAGSSPTRPPDPAHTRYIQLFDALITRRGGDANIGLKLPELLRQAGLGEMGPRIAQAWGRLPAGGAVTPG